MFYSFYTLKNFNFTYYIVFIKSINLLYSFLLVYNKLINFKFKNIFVCKNIHIMSMDYDVLSKDFEADGFVHIKKYLSSSDVEIIGSVAEQLYDLPEVKNSYMKYYEKNISRQLARVENFYNILPDFKNLVEIKIKPLVEKIVGNKLYLFKDKINWKLPGGGAFTAHRDNKAWSQFPCKYFMTLALCVDNCTRENGCLEMVRGKNKNISFENSGILSEEEINSFNNWELIESSKYDILLFDSYVPHRSGPNKSDKPRRMIYLTYNLFDDGNYYEKYFDTKRKEFPPEFERDESTIINSDSIYNLANPIK